MIRDAGDDHCTRLDGNAFTDHRIVYLTMDLTALCDDAALYVRVLGNKLWCRVLRVGIDLPVLLVEVELRNDRYELHVGLPVGLESSDVLPVAVKLIREDAAALVEKIRDDVLTEVLAWNILVRDQRFTKHRP